MIGESALASFSPDIFVDARGCPIREQRLVVQIIFFIITETVAEATGLIEEPLVEHDITSRWLGLAQGDLLRNIPISISLVFGLV